MARYRKKPVVIEAHHWDGTPESARAIIDWVTAGRGSGRYHPAKPERTDGLANGVTLGPEPAHLAIDTLEGTMRAFPCDWVIKGLVGEFYPCKPDIFTATYDLVDDDA